MGRGGKGKAELGRDQDEGEERAGREREVVCALSNGAISSDLE